jgi:hypothetical protein
VSVDKNLVGVKSEVRNAERESGAGKGSPESEVDERDELESLGDVR